MNSNPSTAEQNVKTMTQAEMKAGIEAEFEKGNIDKKKRDYYLKDLRKQSRKYNHKGLEHGGRHIIKRNAPCPMCNSGRKFKKCCGSKSSRVM